MNPETTAASATGPRILVVDDEPAIVDAVATTLRYNDYAVAEASSGHEAFAKALELTPDLLVLDRVLPDFDGTELVHRLRAARVLAA